MSMSNNMESTKKYHRFLLECDKLWFSSLVKVIRKSIDVAKFLARFAYDALCMAIWWLFSVRLGGPIGYVHWRTPCLGVYCSDTLFIMQVLYRIIYCDDNVVMMPKGREQVLSSTWGANKEDTWARNPFSESLY